MMLPIEGFHDTIFIDDLVSRRQFGMDPFSLSTLNQTTQLYLMKLLLEQLLDAEFVSCKSFFLM